VTWSPLPRGTRPEWARGGGDAQRGAQSQIRIRPPERAKLAARSWPKLTSIARFPSFLPGSSAALQTIAFRPVRAVEICVFFCGLRGMRLLHYSASGRARTRVGRLKKSPSVVCRHRSWYRSKLGPASRRAGTCPLSVPNRSRCRRSKSLHELSDERLTCRSRLTSGARRFL
jgi:hypothetical protein